jgi:glycosyltransferase involved in cell wall biosynthesis
MKVSIVIRTKNEESWLKACLLAVNSQTVKDVEVVIVDNNSSDKTVDVAMHHGVKKIVNIDKYLPGDALNRGVSECSGDLVVFLSAHCVPSDNFWLENLIRPVIDGISVASYGRQVPTPASNPENARDLLMFFGAESVIQETDYKFHNANSCIKMDYFNKFRFDPEISNIEDWYWGKEVIERGDKIAYQAEASVFHHHGVNQHEEGASFRSVPVANLLSGLYPSDSINPLFMMPSQWEGLVILSCVSHESLKLVSKIEGLRGDKFKFDVQATGHFNNTSDIRVLSVDKTLTFDKYLQNVLSRSEEESGKLYDYIVFVDDHYAELDLDLIDLNISNLFKRWVDVSTAARRVKGWLFNYPTNGQTLMPMSSKNIDSIEALQGQGSAMRTSVVRRNALYESKLYISSIVERRLAFKRV